MSDPTATHATFVIERDYAAPPQRVFAAFADPAVKRRWFVEDRHNAVEAYQTDFRVGGHDRTVFRWGEGTPFPGKAMANDTVYLDIISGRRIVFAYTMSLEEKPFSASLTTIELQPSGQGTRMVFTEQAAFFEGADGPKMREEGWTSLLGRLGQELARP
jgi:uncharacterized protein YndB with AHSA1/START domain